MASALLTTGRRTVANLLRTAGPLAEGHKTSYQRVLSTAAWSGLHLAGLVLRRLVPDGLVTLVGDDTVDGHPGQKVSGHARHRVAVRSSHSYTAWRYGHKWVVLAVLVRFPGRLFVFVGVAGYGTHEVARFYRRHHSRLTLVRKLHPDANLYGPPPYAGKGRPRVKGARLPKLLEAVARRQRFARLEVGWYGGGTRRVRPPVAPATGTSRGGTWCRCAGCSSAMPTAPTATSTSLPPT